MKFQQIIPLTIPLTASTSLVAGQSFYLNASHSG